MSEVPLNTQNEDTESGRNNIEKLRADFDMIEERNRNLNSNSIINDNKIEEANEVNRKRLKDMMVDAGVDLNDTNSINEFLSKLSEKDPDLLILFESLFTRLFGEENPIADGEASNLEAPLNPMGQPEIPKTPDISNLSNLSNQGATSDKVPL